MTDHLNDPFNGMRQRQPRNYDVAAAEMRGDANHIDGDPPDEADKGAPENLTVGDVLHAREELMKVAPPWTHVEYGLGYAITKSEREKRIDGLAAMLEQYIDVKDEDIVYQAIDALRETWRAKKEGGGQPTGQRPYAELARLVESTHHVLERDRKQIARLKRRVRRLRRRLRRSLDT